MDLQGAVSAVVNLLNHSCYCSPHRACPSPLRESHLRLLLTLLLLRPITLSIPNVTLVTCVMRAATQVIEEVRDALGARGQGRTPRVQSSAGGGPRCGAFQRLRHPSLAPSPPPMCCPRCALCHRLQSPHRWPGSRAAHVVYRSLAHAQLMGVEILDETDRFMDNERTIPVNPKGLEADLPEHLKVWGRREG